MTYKNIIAFLSDTFELLIIKNGQMSNNQKIKTKSTSQWQNPILSYNFLDITEKGV